MVDLVFLQKITKCLRFWPGEEKLRYVEAVQRDLDEVIKGLWGRYVLDAEVEQLCERFRYPYESIKAMWIPQWHWLYPQVKVFFDAYEHLKDAVEACNRAFVSAELVRCDGLLSDIDGKSLDEQQRRVVVTDAARNLVLAGAGSGKTLTIAGKVKYLCEEKHVDPKDILLIAFTRKSAEEMTQRISGKLGIPVEATTFHKLGLDIIKLGKGTCPDIEDSLWEFVREYFENIFVGNPEAVRDLIEYFAYYLHIPADMEEFDSLGDAYAHEKGRDFETIQGKWEQNRFLNDNLEARRTEKRTLQSEVVKSLEEVSIANFLFLNGVRYEYEKIYPFPADDGSHKPYHPDFYLPDYDIYIEHFGINKHGKLPWLSPVEEKKYQEGMQWKRKIHTEYKTKLIETYSYYSSDGVLLECLAEKLKGMGVQFHQRDFSEIFNAIYAKESDKYFSEFMKLCGTFITLFKSNGYSVSSFDELRSKNPKHRTHFHVRRLQLFKAIIRPLLVGYDEYLRERNAVDFSDMINLATDIVETGGMVHPYRWVIIDEYQDISVARYKLVRAILQRTNAKLLCVGDDWQSIYRFAGSDISLFTEFEQYFGSAKVMAIEKTYRNSQQLIDEAGRFVMRNSAQMKKHLRSGKQLDYPITFLGFKSNPFAMLRTAVRKIVKDFGTEASIMLLGRTQYDLVFVRESGLFDVRSQDKIIFNEFPNVPIFFLTVHKSKGLEADNVILLNFDNSTLGFPNKIADDPLLELVLTQCDSFDYAEERRLLYVALTRTRNRIFILFNENQPSEFLREFSASKSVCIHSGKNGTVEPEILCPRCKTGQLIVRKNEGSNQYFVGCSNYPRCDYTVNQTSIMTDTRICSDCGGFLVKRRGPYGVFWGCTNYPYCHYKVKEDL